MSDRGMKKWIPYQSLIEHDEFLKKYRLNKNKIDKPILFEDKIEEINLFLTNLDFNNLVKITYFENGNIIKIIDKIKRIDLNNQSLIISDIKIPLTNLLDIEYFI